MICGPYEWPSPDPTLRASLVVAVDDAARVIAPLWPLSTFIAVNPLWDLRHLSFHDAVAAGTAALGGRGYPSGELLSCAQRQGRITDADIAAALAEHLAAASSPEGGPGRTASELRAVGQGGPFDPGSVVAVNREVAKWCAAHLGGHTPPGASGGFFAAWREAVGVDPGAARLVGREGRARLARLPARPDDALTVCLSVAGIDVDSWPDALTRHLVAMPGWAGHAKWRSRWAPPQRDSSQPTVHLLDYLAVRVAYHALVATESLQPDRHRLSLDRRRPSPNRRRPLGAPGAVTARPAPAAPALAAQLDELDPIAADRVWLAAYEGHYRDELLGALAANPPAEIAAPAAQMVCCIDARSEGLRRHLEAVGPYETFGFAGFFGLPIRYRGYGAEPVDLCPVLIRPTAEVTETPGEAGRHAAERALAGRRAIARSEEAFHAARAGMVAPYVLAEAGGIVAGPVMAAKTFAPARYQRLRKWTATRLAPPAPHSVAVTDAEMPDAAQALFAETALTTMGLTEGFAPLIILCGHGSSTVNNPHAAALDCGACGGNRGANSARSAAAVLNRRPVRRLLEERGIAIPEGTWFVAAEHDTATDQVRLLDIHTVPASHHPLLASVAADLARAGDALAAERCASLPRTSRRPSAREVLQRSGDWAELQPEWGLARNAAFVVGPRTLTSRVNLQRRAFLHSYNPAVDPDGAALETILTAPMIVAHWINAQYYFSTVDPDIYAAGDKTVHNVVAGVGVIEGAGGDLKAGLPLQSLFDDHGAFHEPLRLLTIIEAPLERIDLVIARNPVLQHLFGGAWVHLAARSHPADSWHLYRADGAWTAWQPAHLAATTEPQPDVSGTQRIAQVRD